MKPFPQFLAELKRRNVFKVAWLYGIVGFGVLQVADLTLPRLGLPDWTVTFMLAVVLLAFPVALILAWAFEVTPEGVRRAEGASPEEMAAILDAPASARWPSGLLALVGVAALVAGAWWVGRQGAYTERSTGAGAGTAAHIAGAGEARLTPGELRDDDRPSIAVLPFADMSRENDQEYFSDGMTEELLNTLASIRELRVSGRTSTFAYKGRGGDLRRIGRELGVRYIVEGSVRKDGEQLRITAQLIDADDGSHLWSEQYDRTLEGVFAIQSEIAVAIASELRVPLGLENPTDLVQPAGDFDAYDLYLAARARMRERGPSMNEAVRLYEAAIAADSTWAPAWAGLAEALEIRLWYESPFDGQIPDSATVARDLAAAERAAQRALALDPRNASAHVALGNVLRDRFDWAPAERAYRNALAFDPDNAEAHQQYAELLMAMGRIEESVRAADRAAALDPAPVRFNMLGAALKRDDRADEAERAFERGILLDPDGSVGGLRGNLGLLHYSAGRYEEALDAWKPPSSTREEREREERQYREWVGWLQQGTLDAFPDSARRYLNPNDWLKLGLADSAAAALAGRTWDSGFRLEIGTLYLVWLPEFDALRSHAILQAYLRERGLGGVTVQRTVPGAREVPIVLRDAARVETP